MHTELSTIAPRGCSFTAMIYMHTDILLFDEFLARVLRQHVEPSSVPY